MAQTLTIETTDGPMRLYDSEPAGPVRGGVVVVQEAFGVTGHIQSVCDRLARHGWRAVAPHLFHRAGDPELGYDSGLDVVMPFVKQLNGPDLLIDVDAALDHLAGVGIAAARTAIIGFCMGGTAAAFAATERALGAAATFYGSGVMEPRWSGVPALVELAPRLRAPWFGAYGDQDSSIPVEQVEQLREAATHAEVPVEIVRYPDAGHGFHCDDRPSAYHEASARDAWSRALAWFDQHIPEL